MRKRKLKEVEKRAAEREDQRGLIRKEKRER
jgi:hypothetical protein